MDKAINRKDGKVYLIKDWLINFGPNYMGECMVCGNSLKIRADHTSARTAHFWHNRPHTKCPTIEQNISKYSHLTPTTIDKENAIKVKSEFVENYYYIYLKCDQLCDGSLRFAEFRNLVEKANKQKIWYYKDLSIEYIPYILLTLEELFKISTNYKKQAFYFCFEPNMNNFDDLWIRTNLKKKLWRIHTDVSKNIEEFSINNLLPKEPFWVEKSRERINKMIN
ncbi:hypothetical protein M5X00_07895 [Paenibacillus alvei]|uniref:Competence protein n=1 Tax=Paenibacillus alvei TaxID=44250 RepID=A0ABT4H6Q1_PAEAL|nr:hypothetical protein [Paenibacillus alvei]EJW17218.1 hypothetical protein PAV_4c03210 [Paenibacillus alvei DSM 29]MCY9542342.1 hypothetical protein [Paenibacillus alvei]MCY9705356.1 hypothetical protein [Paenibacillus alvei]MCY9735081.1 hypothetical protein [Paenibacillus alvei]MCY9754175.1 hypothetical protein [Paenibacillus alvei]